MQYEATQRFSITVMHRGGSVFVRGEKGDSISLDPEIADLVNSDIPGTLVVPAPKKNRQVTAAKNRKG